MKICWISYVTTYNFYKHRLPPPSGVKLPRGDAEIFTSIQSRKNQCMELHLQSSIHLRVILKYSNYFKSCVDVG